MIVLPLLLWLPKIAQDRSPSPITEIHRLMAGLPPLSDFVYVTLMKKVVLDKSDPRSTNQRLRREWLGKYNDKGNDLEFRLRAFERFRRTDIVNAYSNLSLKDDKILVLASAGGPDSAVAGLSIHESVLAMLSRYLLNVPKRIRIAYFGDSDAIWNGAPVEEGTMEILFPFSSVGKDGTIILSDQIFPSQGGPGPAYNPVREFELFRKRFGWR